MDYLSLDLKNQDCLLIGSGAIAMQHAQALEKAGAAVHVVAPDIDEVLQNLAVDSGGSALLKNVDSSDLPGRILLIAVSDDAEENEQAILWAKENDMLVYTASQE